MFNLNTGFISKLGVLIKRSSKVISFSFQTWFHTYDLYNWTVMGTETASKSCMSETFVLLEL